ncbi:MAG: ABC transporter ATP-binding protein [Deltaproteobacteria bacterium]|nr:ABC transporter ATP-binding protein [Deltaproteobacteria bacterium]MBN2674227.1 ABC transporter ATP-binding protein [Deltaproteobacteria bacterium]
MITAKNLCKRYQNVEAVKNVNVEIQKGEIVGLLGQNGAGKTTMMKMITGFLEPTEGTVLLGGKDVLEDRIAVQRQIGYMPENAPLYHEMLVQEYLLMIADLREIPSEKQREMIVEAVKATGIEKYLTRPIGTLSKGYKQRVGICQAILHQPDVLILDEPTNGLDPVQIIEIRHLIIKLAQKSTVIVSTHILQEIEAVCDRVLILIDGELVKDAPLGEFLTSNRIEISLADSVGKSDLEMIKSEVSTIGAVEKQGRDNSRKGFTLWSLEWNGDAAPIPELLNLAADQKWQVGSVTSKPPSLEQAFNSLMIEHAEQKAKKEDAA